MTVTRSAAQSLDWQAHAACQSADADDFFPDGPEDAPATVEQVERAKQTCAACTVSNLCRAYGETEQWGIWGGTTEDQRAQTRRGDQLAARRARKQTERAA